MERTGGYDSSPLIISHYLDHGNAVLIVTYFALGTSKVYVFLFLPLTLPSPLD
jgi:hypothetical protein